MTEPESIPALKAAAREDARMRRATAQQAAGDAAGQELVRAFESEPALRLAPGSVVAGYWPIGEEIDPRPLMESLAAAGHRLALPAIVPGQTDLAFHTWRPGDELALGPFRTQEPLPSAPEAIPRMVLVPLLAYDARGYRLGYGKGVYDATLSRLRRGGHTVAVGLAFAAQRMDLLPRDSWDQPLDWVLTEQGAEVFS